MVRLSSQLLMLNHESHIEVLQPRTLINTTKALTSVFNRIAQIQVFVRLHQYLFLWLKFICSALLRIQIKLESNPSEFQYLFIWLKFTRCASLRI